MKIHYVFAVIALFSCAKEAPRETVASGKEVVPEIALSPEQVKQAALTTGFAETRAVERTLRLNGVVDVTPGGLVSVSVPYGGYIRKLELLPGQRVKKGQVIAMLEDPGYIELQESYLVARTRLAFLELEFERQKDLNADKSSSDKTLQQVSSDFAAQRVLVRSLEEKLGLLGINPATLHEKTLSSAVPLRAPITGYVRAVHVNAGKYVTPTDVLLEVVDPTTLHLSLTVFEKDLGLVRHGQTVRFTSPAYPGETFTGTIAVVAPDLSRERTAEIHAEISGGPRGLVPGVFVTAEVSVAGAESAALPDGAVVSSGGKSYVFTVVRQNTFRMVPVETAGSNDGYTAISGSLPRDPVVLSNAYTLLMHLRQQEE